MQNNIPDRKGLAIASLVIGIIALILCFIPIVNFILAIAGIITSALSLKSSKKGLAIGGLVTSIIGLVLGGIITICTVCAVGGLYPEIQKNIMESTCESAGGTYNNRTQCCIYDDGTQTCADD